MLACPLIKAHKLSFKATFYHLIKPFDLVFIDIVTSIKYFLLLVDDNTKFMWIYFLSTKIKTKLVMSLFKDIFNRLFECSLKTI